MEYTLSSKEVTYLIHKAPYLAKLFNHVGSLKTQLERNHFKFLVYTILGQQISVKQADNVFNRLLMLTNNTLDATTLSSISKDQLKSIKIPEFKIKYLNALIQAEQRNHFNLSHLQQLSHPKRIKHLTKITGIGVWSAEMFCMFVLGEEDLFSFTDKGLQNALRKYLNKPDITLIEMREIAQQWEPYKSIVAHYLWSYWDNPKEKGESNG